MLVRRIYEWAQAAPDKTAIVYCGVPISYRGFALRIEHARKILARQPLRPGSIAAIRAENMIDSWVIALALRSLGMTTIPVPSLDQIDALGLGDFGCIVTDVARESGEPARPRDRDYVMVRIRRGVYLGEPGGELPDPRRMASAPGGHIMLTSGTTGSVKKVRMDDAMLAARLTATAALCGFDDRSVVCLFNFGLTSALSVMTCTVWDVGGAVVLEKRPDLHLCLTDPAVTYAHASPAILARLLAAPPGALRPRDTLSIGVGGGALPAALAEQVRARITPNLFVHVASTEVGIWSITPIKTEDDLGSHRIVSGREVQVVDDAEQPLPPGQTGQIRIRIIDGATGYLGDEAASRVAFRNGYFYPGDLGFFQEDGRLVLQGRTTDVINILGRKTAPEPIERALQARLGVDDVCIVSSPVAGAGEEIHVAIQSQRSFDQAALAAAWSRTTRGLPQPRFHLVAALPRTDSGKVQRSVLRERIRAGAL
jgi:acyl-CoA synthetase (AMP-forming)/AMP-acid ligase II